MQIGTQLYPYSDVAEARKQTPTTAKAINVQVGPGDVISNIPIFTLFEHHQVHEGEAYQVCYPPASLANGATLNFRIVVGNQTPTTKTPHMICEIDSTGESWGALYENPTTTGNGNQMTANNRNRNSSNSPVTTIWAAPTVTNVGTLLTACIIGSGERSGGNGRESIEWDLAANTVYIAQVTAKNANNVCLRFQWYEDLGV